MIVFQNIFYLKIHQINIFNFLKKLFFILIHQNNIKINKINHFISKSQKKKKNTTLASRQTSISMRGATYKIRGQFPP